MLLATITRKSLHEHSLLKIACISQKVFSIKLNPMANKQPKSLDHMKYSLGEQQTEQRYHSKFLKTRSLLRQCSH
jgi:hypothetical protein